MLRLNPSRPFRDLRRGCCACLILLLLCVLLLGCLLAVAISRWFTPTTQAAGEGERQAVLLVPAIPSAPQRPTPFGAFFTNQVSVRIAAGPVLLASTPDGKGAIMTDDQFIMDVVRPDQSRVQWSHDFRTGGRPGVAPIPAQDVTALFQIGANIVMVTLVDLTPDTYSSLPYYLVFTAATSSPTPTVTRLSPSTTPPVQKTASPTVARTVSVTTVAPTAAITGKVTITPTLLANTLVPTPTQSKPDGTAPIDWTPWLMLGGGMSFVGVVVFAAWTRQRGEMSAANQLPQMFGWIDLYDNQTRESLSSIDLSRWSQGLTIWLDPLVLQAPGEEAQCIAAIRPSENGAVILGNNVPIMSALGREDELQAADTFASEGLLLQDGMELVIGGRLELAYRNPHATSDANFGSSF